MMTLKQKKPYINNDVNWNHVNKNNLLLILAVAVTFLTTIQLMVI